MIQNLIKRQLKYINVTKKCNYIKHYNFLLWTKRKGKKGLIGDKVETENVELKVIK